MKTSDFFVKVESLIRRLVDTLSEFSQSEKEEVLSFVDVGEYGLAVETAYSIIIEENKPITRQAYELFVELVALMDLGNSVKLERLATQVSG